MKKIIALLLSLTMLAAPVLAAEGESTTQPAAAWAIEYLTDAESLGLLDTANSLRLYETVTAEDLAAMEESVSYKLSVLLPANEGATSASIDGSTRGTVLSLLADIAEDYIWENTTSTVSASNFDLLNELAVVRGDGATLALERDCTVQEMIVFATRLVLNAYDFYSAGTKGLLWEVTDPNTGSKLYLMGTYHVDRGDMYPMHESVRAAVLSSDQVYFELDFLDATGLVYYMTAMVYPEGESLKDNISAETYDALLAVAPAMGLDEATLNQYKPWALAATMESLLTQDETTGDSALAVDSYLFSLALLAGLPTGGIETYELQTNVFDTLSPEYQEAYLAANIELFQAALNGSLEASDSFDALQEPWSKRDADGFHAVYGKDNPLNSTNELFVKLFDERDPGMVESALGFLALDNTTTFLAVGAGHMVGATGIVAQLEAAGYTVTVVV